MSFIKRFAADEAGLETVEYAILAGLVVAGALAVITSIGGKVKGTFDTLDTGLGS